MELCTYIHKIITFFLDFLTISYLFNNMAIHLSVSIIFNIIKSKASLIRSAPNNLCRNHKWPIKAAWSKMKLHVLEWPIITAMSSAVKLHLILVMIIYLVIIFIFFKNTDTEKILEVSVFKYVFEIRSISISIWKYKY